MPVEVPWRASTLTVNAVRMLSVLSDTISGRSSSRARSDVMGAQIRPEVWCKKKAIFSGVACSAAMMRSPSFSRSSSSTTTTISPRPTAAMASSTLAKPMSRTLLVPREQALDVLHGHVDLEVHPVTGASVAERRDLLGVRDHRHREPVVEHVHHREAHAVDRDGALLDHVAQHVVRHADPEVGRRHDDLADPVDVALHDVAAEAVEQPHGPLEVDPVAGGPVADRGAGGGLGRDVRLPPAGAHLDDGQATAVDGDRVADLGVLEDVDGRDAQAEATGGRDVTRAVGPGVGGAQGRDLAELLDDPSEHQLLLTGCRSTRRSSPRVATDVIRPRHTSAMVAAPWPANNLAASTPPNSAGARYRT